MSVYFSKLEAPDRPFFPTAAALTKFTRATNCDGHIPNSSVRGSECIALMCSQVLVSRDLHMKDAPMPPPVVLFVLSLPHAQVTRSLGA